MGSGLPVTVVHLPDFYGPNVVNPMVKPLLDDAARALIAVASQDKCYGKRYTVGGIEKITVHRFAEMIYREAGAKGRVRGMPFWLLRLLGLFSAEARAGAGMMHTFAWDVAMDGTAIRRDAGFAPRVGYEEGIRRTLAWFRAT
jgi:nucleoside-diphosphate-sugar epimerase